MRNLLQESEIWTHAPPTFIETMVIYEEEGRYFVEHVSQRFGPRNPLTAEKIEALCGRELQMDRIWPAYDDVLTIAAGDTQNLFLKKPNIIDVALKEPEIIQKRVLAEAHFCEEISKSPHPNVVDYRGCLVEDGRIHGLWLKRYRETLYDRVKRSHNNDKILADVMRGIEHLHSLGIIHNDLQPGNIMFDDNDNAIIIDLDSGHWTGVLLSAADKRSQWFTKEAVMALPENDHYSITRIKDFLEGGMEKIINS